jgi:hypothetical protein
MIKVISITLVIISLELSQDVNVLSQWMRDDKFLYMSTRHELNTKLTV